MDRLIERLEAPIRPGKHHSAFHCRQNMRRETCRFNITRQPIRGIFDKPPDRIAPCLEILDNQTAGCRLAVAHFESQIPDRTSQIEVRGFQQQPITFQHRKKSFDRVLHPVECGFQHSWLKQRLIFFQHGDQQILLARKEVVEASAIRIRSFENLSDTGGDIALPEE